MFQRGKVLWSGISFFLPLFLTPAKPSRFPFYRNNINFLAISGTCLSGPILCPLTGWFFWFSCCLWFTYCSSFLQGKRHSIDSILGGMNFKQFFLSYVPKVALHGKVCGIKILLLLSFPHVGRFLLHEVSKLTGCESWGFFTWKANGGFGPGQLTEELHSHCLFLLTFPLSFLPLCSMMGLDVRLLWELGCVSSRVADVWGNERLNGLAECLTSENGQNLLI